jgi:hypothetical protein
MSKHLKAESVYDYMWNSYYPSEAGECKRLNFARLQGHQVPELLTCLICFVLDFQVDADTGLHGVLTVVSVARDSPQSDLSPWTLFILFLWKTSCVSTANRTNLAEERVPSLFMIAMLTSLT